MSEFCSHRIEEIQFWTQDDGNVSMYTKDAPDWVVEALTILLIDYCESKMPERAAIHYKIF